MHLVNQTDGGHSDGESGRLTPRLERRKVSVRRDDLLRQAEQTMNHLGHSRFVCFVLISDGFLMKAAAN